MSALELALSALLSSRASSDYFLEIANTECTGANRAKKMVTVLNRLTVKNRLCPYIEANKDQIERLLNNKHDKKLLFVALFCGAYSIAYDLVELLGKFLHVQSVVGRELLLNKLSQKYGSNHALVVAFDSVMPMLLELEFVRRQKPAVYEKAEEETAFSKEAMTIYEQAFLLNNPHYTSAGEAESNPFFEFIK